MKTLYSTNFRSYAIIALVSFFSTIILWVPFIVSNKFDTVLRHWDGPLYIIPAKTFYNIHDPLLQENILGLPEKYFAAHLPGYPMAIRSLAPFVGYPKATVVATLFFAIALFWAFFYVVQKLRLSSQPLLLTLVFMFVTPRFFVVRSVGSPEPLFILGILLSVYFFVQRKYLLAGILGGIAAITKTPAILLFVAYSIFFGVEYARNKKISAGAFSILLIPIALLGVFCLYALQYGDFYAYFNSGDNLHVMFPPFQTFNSQAYWVGTGWLEDIMFVYFLYGYALMELMSRLALHVYRSKNLLANWLHILKERCKLIFGLHGFTSEQDRFFGVTACFVLVFYLAVVSIEHRDVSRYALPMLPFALITFERFFTSYKFRILLAFLIPAIYMYAWNFMGENVMPDINWTPFL